MRDNSADLQDEKLLLEGLQSGDEDAFAEIYRLYSARLFYNIQKLVKSRGTAEEILQDIFVSLWEKGPSLQIHTSLRAYLFRIAENRVCDFFRHAQRDQALYTLLKSITTEAYSHIEETLLAKENKALLLQAIDTLPPQRKLIFKRCKMEGKSYQEVSQELGISTSTVNDHIVKATRSLRDFIVANQQTFLPLIIAAILKSTR
jgi:RNA polymerase sigma-70 factor (family 1)